MTTIKDIPKGWIQLTQEQVNQLPEGTEVWVSWSGWATWAAPYRIHQALGGGTIAMFGDTMVGYLTYVSKDRVLNRVWASPETIKEKHD